MLLLFRGGSGTTTSLPTGLPRLVYNGKNIDFPINPWDWRFQELADRRITRPLDGSAPEVKIVKAYDRISLKWRFLLDLDLRRQIKNWWIWACEGNAFQFALNRSDMVKTKLSGSATAGSNSVSVVSATDILVGNTYMIQAYPVMPQLVKVAGISGTTITFTETLDRAFASGAVLRSLYYWDATIEDSSDDPITDLLNPPNSYNCEIVLVQSLI